MSTKKEHVSPNLKIEIRPLPDKKDVRKFTDNPEMFSGTHTFSALVDPVTMKYRTGLGKEDLDYLKKDMQVPYDLSDNFVPGVPHPFWESRISKITLSQGPEFLYPGRNVLDFIKWKYLLASPYMYVSQEDIKKGGKFGATHYIYNEDVENQVKAKLISERNKLNDKIEKLPLTRKRDLVMLIENENTDNKAEDYLTIKFEEITANKEKRLLLENYLNKPTEEVSLAATIKNAIQRNVLTKNKQGIFYYETNIGFSEQNVLEFLTKDENQEMLINIKSRL